MAKTKKTDVEGVAGSGTQVPTTYLPHTHHNLPQGVENEETLNVKRLSLKDTDREHAAAELRRLNGEMFKGVKRITRIAIESGRWLVALKDTFPQRAPKGSGFYDWLEEHVGYSKTTAVRYEKAFTNYERYIGEGRTEILTNLTLSALTGYDPSRKERDAEDSVVVEEEVVMEADTNTTTPADTELMRMVFDLNEKEEKRALSYARYFGDTDVAKQQARFMVWSKRPAPKNEAGSVVAPTVIKRTLRYNPITDGYIQNVARRTGRSYNDVNEEALRLGLPRFKKKYDLS